MLTSPAGHINVFANQFVSPYPGKKNDRSSTKVQARIDLSRSKTLYKFA